MKREHSPSNGPSQRQLRAAEQLRHIIAETMNRGHFHHEALLNVEGITVSEVRVTPDLKNAKAFVMSLGGDDMDVILPALNKETHVFQKEIGRQQSMKFTPRIHFVRDESFDEAQKIDQLLRDVIPAEDTDNQPED